MEYKTNRWDLSANKQRYVCLSKNPNKPGMVQLHRASSLILTDPTVVSSVSELPGFPSGGFQVASYVEHDPIVESLPNGALDLKG